MKLNEIEEQSHILLHIRNDISEMDLGGTLERLVNDNLAIITLDYGGKERLVFENVQIDMEYIGEDGLPYLWVNVQIHNHKGAYVLQTVSDGSRFNRRNSFRVGVSKMARCSTSTGDSAQVMVKDISLSGFSIIDRSHKIHLTQGQMISILFEDLDYRMDLDGRLVRIEQEEDYTIYGFVICNVCNELSPYVNTKQVINRRNKHQRERR